MGFVGGGQFGKGVQVMPYAAVNMRLLLREEILYNFAVTILLQNILFMVNVIVKSITDKVIIIKKNWRKGFFCVRKLGDPTALLQSRGRVYFVVYIDFHFAEFVN